jgi:DNA-binding LacI/PurR family transcriptional regulator
MAKHKNIPSVRMIDIANKVGVSTATVGRVLHNRGYVSEKSRRLVEQAIAETGFQINRVAQTLRRQRSYTIGHILTSLLPNPFYAGVEVGVEQAAAELGYSVVIWNAMNSASREHDGIEAFIQRQVEAVIFTTPLDGNNVRRAIDAGLEVVQVERPIGSETHIVSVDNYHGTCAAVKHLLALGHREIGYLGKILPGSPEIVDNQRYRGYTDTLRAAGITIQKEWVLLGLEPYLIEDGYRGFKQLYARNPALTAVMVFSDIMACGVLQAAYELKLRIPDDLSVIGFDNTYAPYLSPPLSTVAIPMVTVGKAAAQLAITALEQQQLPAVLQKQNIPTELIIRHSTASPPAR